MVLSDDERSKLDTGDDGDFYDSPRFVTHADEAFLARLTELYTAVLEPGDRVFDAMSSWVSHLPDYRFERVVGHGLNEAELAENDALTEWFVQDFNSDQSLPLADGSFDAVLCALSVQYLQYPEAVFSAFARVLAPDGVLAVTFTNRLFPTKAVRAWRASSLDERAALVESYCRAAGLTVTDVVRERPGEDPFYAVVSDKPR
jgi:SAM-dependent methyltransferase